MAKKSSSKNFTIKPDDEWRVEMDLNALIEAEKIRKDAKRMEKVKVLARKRLENTASVLAEANES